MRNTLVVICGVAATTWTLYAIPASILQSVAVTAILVGATLGWAHLLRPTVERGPPAIEFIEWRSVLGFAFVSATIATYLIASMYVAGRGVAMHDATKLLASQVAVFCVGAWLADQFSQRMWGRWCASTLADERDEAIATYSWHWGYGAMATCVIGVAFSITQSRTPSEHTNAFAIANMLGFALLWGLAFRYGVACVLYWRDRRSQLLVT